MASAIACGTPNSEADGQPSAAGANVSQINCRECCWREVNFISRSRLTKDSQRGKETAGTQQLAEREQFQIISLGRSCIYLCPFYFRPARSASPAPPW